MQLIVGRLKRRPEFLRVARSGRKWVAPGLVLQARRRDVSSGPGTENTLGDALIPRVGFTVSRRVGTAVERNRVRRRLRAAVEQALPARVRERMDIVVIGRRVALTRSFADLVCDLEVALKRVGACRKLPSAVAKGENHAGD
jgi:ribonuclease P protein component